MYWCLKHKNKLPFLTLLLLIVACSSPSSSPSEPVKNAATRGLNIPQDWGIQLKKIPEEKGLPCANFSPDLINKGEEYTFRDTLYAIEEQTKERLSFFAEDLKGNGAYKTQHVTYQWLTDFPTSVLAMLSTEERVYNTGEVGGYKCDLSYSISFWEWNSGWMPVTTNLLTNELQDNFKATNRSFTYRMVDNYFCLNLKKGDETLVNDLKFDIHKHKLTWNYSSTNDLALEWVLDKFEVVDESTNVLECYQSLQQKRSNQLSYLGRIDNQYDIEMDLVFEKIENADCGQWQQIQGTYRYLSKNVDIVLEGEYCQTTNQISLVERHENGTIRELFKGAFMDACRIEGIWSLEGGNNLPFYLERRKDAL